MTNADVKRALSTLPLTALPAGGVLLAFHGLWVLAVATFGAAVGYFAWLQVWQRNRDADDAIKRAHQHDLTDSERNDGGTP